MGHTYDKSLHSSQLMGILIYPTSYTWPTPLCLAFSARCDLIKCGYRSWSQGYVWVVISLEGL
jgi:hypothetical protein